MLIKNKEAKKFTIPGGTEGLIYPSDLDGDFTVAKVSINGIYPQKDYSINDISKESLFVLKGEIEVLVEDKKFVLKKGDLIIIKPNKKYQIKGKAEVLDIITPAWEKNKNQIIKN